MLCWAWCVVLRHSKPDEAIDARHSKPDEAFNAALALRAHMPLCAYSDTNPAGLIAGPTAVRTCCPHLVTRA